MAAAPIDPALGQEWGIQVGNLRLIADGDLLSLSYMVRDPTKAAWLARQDKQGTYLVDEASGTMLPVSGAARALPSRSRATALEAKHTYLLQFQNPSNLVRPGSMVTLVMGEFKAEHLTVE